MLRTSAVLKRIIRDLGIEDEVKLSVLRTDWETIFEKPLRLHVYPARLSEGNLWVNVSSPVWSQQLTYYKKDIVDKLRPYGVRDIRFRIGKTGRREEAAPTKAPAVLSDEDETFIKETTDCIDDHALREAVRGAMIKSILKKNSVRRERKITE